MPEQQPKPNPEGSGKPNKFWRDLVQIFKRHQSSPTDLSGDSEPYVPGQQEALPPIEFRSPEPVSDIHRRLSMEVLPEFMYARAEPIHRIDKIASAMEEEGHGLKLTLGEDERLIVQGIPYMDRATGEFLSNRVIQIYRNREGFLIADKVVNGEAVVPATVVLEEIPEGHRISELIPEDRRYNHSKKDTPDGETELLSTTYNIPHGRGSYSRVEIVVRTPDDSGDEIELDFRTVVDLRLDDPITIKRVPDIR